MFVLVAGCNSKKEQQMPAGSASQAEPATTATSAPDVSIFDAAGNGNVDAIKQHIAAGTDIDQKQPITGNTPLNIACSMGQTEVAMALIEADAAIEAKGNEQTTPLFNAAFLCHTKTVQLLLEHDANAHTTDKNGTPLVDVMAAPWEAVAGIYQLVYSLIGVEFDAEEKRTTRPVILKMLKEHIAKETNGKSAMTPNRTAAEIAAVRSNLPPITATDWSSYNHDVRGWRFNSAEDVLSPNNASTLADRIGRASGVRLNFLGFRVLRSSIGLAAGGGGKSGERSRSVGPSGASGAATRGAGVQAECRRSERQL